MLAAAMLLLIGCEPETFLFVDDKPLSFSAEGGGATIDMVANKNWSVSSDNSWCVVSPGSGGGDAGGTRLTVTCSKNESYDNRTATITISCAEMMKRVSVTQSAKGIVVIDKSEYELSYEAQQLEIPLMANTKDYKVTVVSGGEWIEVVNTKGLEKSSFSLDIEENEQKNREGVVYVTTLNDVITLKIKQDDGILVIPDAKSFPDANFRQYCIDNFDKNGDNAISHKEARAVSTINVLTDNISSLEGIKYFIELKELICQGGQNYGKLSSLDISQNTALRVLKCEANQLTYLDVTKNTALTELYCRGNRLTFLDVSRNIELVSFFCGWNQLTDLDVSMNTKLTILDCLYCQLVRLDVSNNLELTTLNCYNNSITSLDVSKNTKMVTLQCFDNPISSLDVSNNINLSMLQCGSEQLTSIDVSKNKKLTWLAVAGSSITSLDVSNNTELTYLNCCYNKLSYLDILNNNKLEEIDCRQNQLTNLDVSKNIKLKKLDCCFNQLTNLDVSKNTTLTYLNCQNNQLTFLDVSNNLLLEALYCNNTTMTDLYLSQGQTFKESSWYSGTTVHYK